MNRDCIRHALYFGLVIGLMFIAHFLLGTTSNMLILSLQFVVLLAVPIIAVRFAIDCRKRVNRDNFTYSQAFRYMMQLFVGASLISSAFVFVYIQWINVDFLPNLAYYASDEIDKVMELIPSLSISEDEMELIIQNTYKTRTFVASHFLGKILVGLFISLIGSFIVRNAKKQ